MKIVTIVGNPKPRSKTYQFAQIATNQLKETLVGYNVTQLDEVTLDLANYGTSLVEWDAEIVTSLVDHILNATYIVIASPTYKASYTGLLKLFLDILPMNALQGKCIFPMMIGAAPHHQLACEVHLKPVLAELGATVVSKGIYLLDSQLDDCDDIIKQWIESSGIVVKSFL